MKQRFVTLFAALIFVVMAATGVIAFVRPFSLEVVGLHALVGFVFIALVVFHVGNSLKPFKKHLRGKPIWICLAITAALTVLIWLQPKPVQALLGLSGNLGPALERFEMSEDRMEFQYSPSADYKMALTVKTGRAYDLGDPPQVAIWLENQGAYHIKTLLAPNPSDTDRLPYWSFKVRGWEKAKRDAEESGDIDGISGATPNGSFDPADYILPAEPENSTPFKLLIEIDQRGDAHGQHEDQPSLVYAVEIDNLLPQTFQLLEIVGYPKREDEDDKEAWALYYTDEGFGSALDLIDSALLTIDRSGS